MGQYDKTMKLLVDSNPEAIARFVLREWQKQEGSVLPNINDIAVTQLSGEFQSEELDADNVLLVEGPDGPLYLVEIEFQSTLHPYMPLRSLEYIARAKKKHWKRYGHLPVVAAVIYLFNDEYIPDSPLHWVAPNGQTTMVFHYLSIKMKDLPREELLALQEPELWPLILLTEGSIDRIIIGDMFAELLEQKLYSTLPLSHTIAAWFLRGDDLAWLNKEYQKMFEFFHDSPAIQWMEDSVRERVIESIRQEERQKANLRIQEEHKKTLEEHKKTLEEHKKTLTTLRQTVVELVTQRFPALQRLAKAQVRVLKEPEPFQQLIIRLSLARDANEAQDVLFALSENEDEDDGQVRE